MSLILCIKIRAARNLISIFPALHQLLFTPIEKGAVAKLPRKIQS